MTDQELINGLFARDEEALRAVQIKYGAYCRSIVIHMLEEMDAEEVLNDVWLALWGSVPPAQPANLRLYLGKIARNAAIVRIEYNEAAKRKTVTVLLDELAECLPDLRRADTDLRDALNRFTRSLREEERRVFLRRYWYGETIPELSESLQIGKSRIAGILRRTRKKLKQYLEKEDLL